MNKIIAKHNPDRPLIENVLDFVKEFIIRNDGILYGGQAIDFTLRKYGMKLYDDDELPDYDFYAKNNVDLAYKLSEELREKNIEVDVIRAIHPQTMRVRVAWNFVADITYLPNFEIPTIDYNNIKLVHPKILLMGQHLSLSFPYYGPPKEAIFQRFFKDLERYNLLYSISSINKEKGGELNYTKISSEIHGIIHGLPAYGIYLKEFQKIKKIDLPDWPVNFKENKIVSSNLIFIKFTTDPIYELREVKRDSTKEFYFPLLDLRPMQEVYEKYEIYWLKNKLLVYNEIDGQKVIGIQFLLLYLLCESVFTDKKYILYYKSLLKMINEMDKIFEKDNQKIANSIFAIHSKVIGQTETVIIDTKRLPTVWYYDNKIKPFPYHYEDIHFKVDGSRVQI